MRHNFKNDTYRVADPFDNPKDYNQHLINKLSHAHGFVMETCLDRDRDDQNSRYAGYELAREVIGREVIQASVESNAWSAAQHTCYPQDIRGRFELNRRRNAA